jgi:hypothetical protein
MSEAPDDNFHQTSNNSGHGFLLALLFTIVGVPYVICGFVG